jgi:hypothetical protein
VSLEALVHVDQCHDDEEGISEERYQAGIVVSAQRIARCASGRTYEESSDAGYR